MKAVITVQSRVLVILSRESNRGLVGTSGSTWSEKKLKMMSDLP